MAFIIKDQSWKFPHFDISNGIDWDAIEKNYDWFREMENIHQDSEWHAEGNVQIHTKSVCDNLVALPEFKELDELHQHIMFTSALFHDIEKRSTTCKVEEDGKVRIKAPKHAQKGEFTARNILYKEIHTPFEIREIICKLVRYHGVPLWKEGEDIARIVVETSQFVSNHLLSMLSKADVLGRTCPDSASLLEKIEFFKMTAEEFDCLHAPRVFTNTLSRYHYFTKETFIDYVPFDETKFTVTMLAGIPGAGKDTYLKNNLSDHNVVSLDDIRRELKVKPTDSKGNGRVIQEAMERCKVLMRKHQNFVFNATNLTKDLRSKWISLFEEYGGLVEIHYIEVPYSTLLKQNNSREHAVPAKVVERLIDKLEMPTCKEVHAVKYITTH